VGDTATRNFAIARFEVRLMPLKILNFALVLFGSATRSESAKIAALAGFGIHLAGIEPILA
jgi:hypothetical protein